MYVFFKRCAAEVLLKMLFKKASTKTSNPKQASRTEFEILIAIGNDVLSGRDIAHKISAAMGETVNYGTVYTLTARMRQYGWVSYSDVISIDSRERFFKVTELGLNIIREQAAYYRRIVDHADQIISVFAFNQFPQVITKG